MLDLVVLLSISTLFNLLIWSDSSQIVQMVTQLFNDSPELNDFIQNLVNSLQSSDVSKEMINNLIQFFRKYFNEMKANRSLIGPVISKIITNY